MILKRQRQGELIEKTEFRLTCSHIFAIQWSSFGWSLPRTNPMFSGGGIWIFEVTSALLAPFGGLEIVSFFGRKGSLLPFLDVFFFKWSALQDAP